MDGSKIEDGTVATADLAANAVTGDKILDGSIAKEDLVPGTVTEIQAGLGLVKSGSDASPILNVASGGIGAREVKDGSLGPEKLAANVQLGGTTTLDQAYDAGSTINADAGPVSISGTGGLTTLGPLGAGTSTPSAQLDVVVPTAGVIARFQDGTESVVIKTGSPAEIGTEGPTDFKISTNNTPVITVTAGGLVGVNVGTNSRHRYRDCRSLRLVYPRHRARHSDRPWQCGD